MTDTGIYFQVVCGDFVAARQAGSNTIDINLKQQRSEDGALEYSAEHLP